MDRLKSSHQFGICKTIVRRPSNRSAFISNAFVRRNLGHTTERNSRQLDEGIKSGSRRAKRGKREEAITLANFERHSSFDCCTSVRVRIASRRSAIGRAAFTYVGMHWYFDRLAVATAALLQNA